MRRWLAPIGILTAIVGLSVLLAQSPPLALGAAYNAARASTLDTYLQRGQQFAGLGPDTAYHWEDFTSFTTGLGPGLPWQQGVAGTGASSAPFVAGYRGGIHRITSGATAASIYNFYSNQSVVAHQGTDRWYVAWRFKVQTAITAQTIAAVGIWGPQANPTVTVGVYGSSSTVNFVLQYDGSRAGTFVSTGKAIDTNFHIVEMWVQGDSKIHASMDGGTDIGPATQASAANDQYCLYATVGNGTDAVTRNVDLDWGLLVAARVP